MDDFSDFHKKHFTAALPPFHAPIPIDGRYLPPQVQSVAGSALTDFPLLRLSPVSVATTDPHFSPNHPYVHGPHMHGSVIADLSQASEYNSVMSNRGHYSDLLHHDFMSTEEVLRSSYPRSSRFGRKRTLSLPPLLDHGLVTILNRPITAQYPHLVSPLFTPPLGHVTYHPLLTNHRGLSLGPVPPLQLLTNHRAFGINPTPQLQLLANHRGPPPPLLLQTPPPLPGRQLTPVSAGNRETLRTPGSDPSVSSTVDPPPKRSKVKGEAHRPRPSSCSPVTVSSADLKDPDQDQSRPGSEPVYETNCQWDDCGREFDSQDRLVQHLNAAHLHGDRKEFVCRWDQCQRERKPFKAQYMLVVHMRRHTGEKPHACTFEGCSKAYSRLENLKTHLRSHTGEKPYLCEHQDCPKAFSNASDRAKHQNRTHSSEKPYVCKVPLCPKRYTDPSSLRKHVKTVHGPDAHVTRKYASADSQGTRRQGPHSTALHRGAERYCSDRSVKSEECGVHESGLETAPGIKFAAPLPRNDGAVEITREGAVGERSVRAAREGGERKRGQ